MTPFTSRRKIELYISIALFSLLLPCNNFQAMMTSTISAKGNHDYGLQSSCSFRCDADCDQNCSYSSYPYVLKLIT